MIDHEAFARAILEHPGNNNPKLVYADALEEEGIYPLLCEALRNGSLVLGPAGKPVNEVESLQALKEDSNWAHVFGELEGASSNNETDACPPGANVDLTPPKLEDVVEIIATSSREDYSGERDWVGVFLLKDGRYLAASGGCDYTGWG